MPEVKILTTFGNWRGTLAGMLGAEPLLKWNANPATNPAAWRAASIPVDGGDPVTLAGQPAVGNVSPVGAFDGAVPCGFARPFEMAGGLILSGGNVVLLERPAPKAIYVSHCDESGVYGTCPGVGGVWWSWDGQVAQTQPSAYPSALSQATVAVPSGYTGFSKRAISPDGRYVAGVGINLNAPTRTLMEVHLLIDTTTDTALPLADVLGCAAISNGLQFAEDGAIVCIAQATPATQSVVRVTGWEG